MENSTENGSYFVEKIDFYECIANIVSPNELNDVPWQIITTIFYSMVFSRRIVADESWRTRE